ncbi:MAG: Plug domain-containing protein [Saprospiraceae bacterium]|nr:Plug domain-containing protein [Saprospiraceae bacterium]
MKKLLFILFLIGIVKLHSQTLVVVKFVDEIGIPISNLGVYVHETKQSMMTDSNGVINLYLVMNEKYYLSLTDPNGLFSLVSIDAITDFIQVNLNSKSIRLNEVSIISNRWQSDKLISSNSLSLEELKNKSDVKDIPYLLQSLASVQVQSEAGNGIGYTGFRIRGIDPNQVQVNLNGIPLNDQESSRTYFVNTPDLIGNTDRIDILSGFVPGRAGTGGSEQQ